MTNGGNSSAIYLIATALILIVYWVRVFLDWLNGDDDIEGALVFSNSAALLFWPFLVSVAALDWIFYRCM